MQGYECEVLKGAARLLHSHRVLALTAEIDRALLDAHGCDTDALRALIQQDTWFNVTSRPTMSESTFFAHRCGALFCEKREATCRMETNGPGSCTVRPEPSATRTIAPQYSSLKGPPPRGVPARTTNSELSKVTARIELRV